MENKVISNQTIREITIVSFTEDGLTEAEAVDAAKEVLIDEGGDWEFTDTERINYDRIAVRFVGI